jgi:hypothetical protein
MGDGNPKMKGTIVKVPDASPGLIMVNGQQKSFTLEGVWKSPVAPAPNQTVEVELGASGAVTSVAVVDAQQFAKDQMKELGNLAQVHGKEAAEIAKQQFGALASRMGPATLGSAVLVWVAWFFFPIASIDSGGGKMSFTFWKLIAADFNDLESLVNGGHHGFFSLIGLLAIAAPFAVPFLRAAWSRYLNAAPLVYIVLGIITMWWKEHAVFKEIAQQAGMNPFSWGFFMTLLLLAIAGFLAYSGVTAPASAQAVPRRDFRVPS